MIVLWIYGKIYILRIRACLNIFVLGENEADLG